MPATVFHKQLTSQKGWLNTARPLTPDDLKGRILLLDFWTFCCINCLQVMPDLAYLEERFGNKLTVIGVHSAKFKNERDDENIRQAILRHKLTHPVVNDFDFSVWNAFGIRAWPTMVLINPMGTIAGVYSGEGHRAEIERDINRLVEQYEGRTTTSPLPLAMELAKAPETPLSFPTKLALGQYRGQDALYIADTGHERILVASLAGEGLASFGSGAAGFADGDAASAQFSRPQGLLLDYPLLYVADTGNHALRVVDLDKGVVTTLAGTGRQGSERSLHRKPAREASLASPWDLAFYPDRQHIVIAQAGLHQLHSFSLADNTITRLAGSGHENIHDDRAVDAALAQPSGLSALGDTLYFIDAETSSLRTLKDAQVKTQIGTGLFDFGYKEGTRTEALMQHPLGLVATQGGVWVADAYNHAIRRFDPKTGRLSNIIGNGMRGKASGAFSKARLNEPNGVVASGNALYIADTNNHAIRVANLAKKTLTTLKISEPQASTAEFSDSLPNTQILPPATVAAGKPLAVSLGLSAGWHINDEAPSAMALFAGRKPLAAFDLPALKSRNLTLPALALGEYRLQGTLYYCEDKAGSQCLLKSFDLEVIAAASGSETLELKLN